MAEKLVLIDGHSILNRAFFGLPDLTNAEGIHTNAVYGFLNIMFKILEEEKPDYLVVAFDVSAPTFRHEIYKEYKGTRKPMAPELRQQVPLMKEMLRAMHVTIMEQAGLEADDILGTLANRAQQQGMEVALVSGDRDLLQIASEHIMIRIPKTKAGKTEVENYYATDVKEKYQVTPTQFIDLKALMGDTSDNIPGVPKVGEKTATELMVQFGSLEEIYLHLEDISKKSVRESLRDNKELAQLSKVLATIHVDAPISLDFETARMHNLYTPESYILMKRLEFKNFLGRYEQAAQQSTQVDLQVHVCDDLSRVQELLDRWKNTAEETVLAVRVYDSVAGNNAFESEDPYAAFTESQGQMSLFEISAGEQEKKEKNAGVMHLAITADGENIYFMDAGKLSASFLRDALRQLMQNRNLSFATFSVKELYRFLQLEDMPVRDLGQRFDDILLAAYLLNPLKNDYNTDDIANEYLGQMLPSYVQKFGKKNWSEAYGTQTEEYVSFLCTECRVIFESIPVLKERLASQNMMDLYRDMEMPLSFVLYRMEQEGMAVNASALKAYGDELENTICQLEQKIYEQAGHAFNINSPKQLGEILFVEKQLPGGKKTKTGYSTSAEVLERLAPECPMVNDILEYRTYTKLKSTYADGLAGYIEQDGRIHTHFNQTITATGRISSTEPNLQNIPMRMEMGRRIRKVFIPRKGCVFVDADYSQVELRILASMAGDKDLIAAYQSGEDIHRITAAKVFHVPFEEVTPLQRRNAKAVNFGIVYGISSFGLSQDLSISKKEAQQYIEDYFETYPGIRDFLEHCKEEAKEKKYSVTMFGRRRPIPELSSSNFMQRSFGERVAMNAPIQGTAADLMKIAMIHVYDRLLQENMKTRIVLQVHDELLLESPEEEKEKAIAILREEMKNVTELPVDLEVDAHYGSDWYETK
ncbi:MAG: DNA polymerase I [Lachnospiraceae bacterium]